MCFHLFLYGVCMCVYVCPYDVIFSYVLRSFCICFQMICVCFVSVAFRMCINYLSHVIVCLLSYVTYCCSYGCIWCSYVFVYVYSVWCYMVSMWAYLFFKCSHTIVVCVCMLFPYVFIWFVICDCTSVVCYYKCVHMIVYGVRMFSSVFVHVVLCFSYVLLCVCPYVII